MSRIPDGTGRLQTFATMVAAAAAIWALLEARSIGRNVELYETRSELRASTNGRIDELRADLDVRFDELRADMEHQLRIVNAHFVEIQARLDFRADLSGTPVDETGNDE